MEPLIFKAQTFYELTDEQLFQLCVDNRDLKIERTSNLDIIVMSPTGALTGKYCAEILRQLANWNLSYSLGEVFDSSAGFILPDKSMRSPDVAWLSMEKFNNITDDEKNKFPHVCPDFIVEVISPSDSLKMLHSKMLDWIKNGCRMALLICPDEEIVKVFYEDNSVKEIRGFNKTISGGDILPGFVLELSLIKKRR